MRTDGLWDLDEEEPLYWAHCPYTGEKRQVSDLPLGWRWTRRDDLYDDELRRVIMPVRGSLKPVEGHA